MMRKSKMIPGEPAGAIVARGEAEIGFQQISELLPVRGIDYVVPLPVNEEPAVSVSWARALHRHLRGSQST